MKILHVVQGLEVNSGVAVFVTELAKAQADAGHAVTVLCDYRPEMKPADNVRFQCNQSGVKGEIQTTDPDSYEVVHLHALWSPFMLGWLKRCRAAGVPYVVSPHGCLMPRVFTKGRLKKFVFWHFLLKPLVKRAAAIHCTSEAEVEACKALGLKGPFVVAPLGVRLPELGRGDRSDLGRGDRSRSTKVGRTVLFLGRLGEEKGLVKLLEVWGRIRSKGGVGGWRLVLAGPDWLGYKQVLDEKIAKDKIEGVEFTGPADAEMKDRLYREADVFVLPSPMENFSMVVLEALAYGVPAIATTGTPWRELEGGNSGSGSGSGSGGGKCGWWIEQGVEALEAALTEAMKMSDEGRTELGRNGRKLAEAKYQWPEIARKLAETYVKITIRRG